MYLKFNSQINKLLVNFYLTISLKRLSVKSGSLNSAKVRKKFSRLFCLFFQFSFSKFSRPFFKFQALARFLRFSRQSGQPADVICFSFPFENWTNCGYFCWIRTSISFKVAINCVCQMSVDKILTIFGGILSGPVAFLESMFLKILFISSTFPSSILNSFFTWKYLV